MNAGLLGSTELWSAVLGAVVGGIITAALQALTHKRNAAVLAKSELQRQQAIASRLIFKLIKVQADIVYLLSHLNYCIDRVQSDEDGRNPWEFFIPLTWVPAEIHFDAEEMGLIVSLDDDDVISRTIDVDANHNIIMNSFTMLTSLVSLIRSSMPVVNVEGESVIAELTPEIFRNLLPKMKDADLLFETLYERLQASVPSSHSALFRTHNLFTRKLRIPIGISKLNDGRSDVSRHAWKPKPYIIKRENRAARAPIPISFSWIEWRL